MIAATVTIFGSYILFLYIRFGVLPSISESYYRLGKMNWLFTLFTWSLAATIISNSTPLFFLSGACLAFVGAANAFKESMTSTVHYIGAGGSIIASMAAFYFDYGLWWPALFALVGSGLLVIVKNRIWWIEIYCFVVYSVALNFKQ